MAEPIRCSCRPSSLAPYESKPNSIDSTQRPPERTSRVPPLKALHALCGINAGMHIVPPPKLTSMRGVSRGRRASRQHHQVPVLQTGTSAGVEPATRGCQAAALPTELTCGGMKQSGRAVRACATRSGTQAHQVGLRTHYRCTIDVSTSSRDPGDPRSQILHLVLTNDFSSPKTTRPRSAVPSGVSWRDRSGDRHLVSPVTHANRANASRLPRRAGVHRRDSLDSPRRLSALSAAACRRLLIDDSLGRAIYAKITACQQIQRKYF